MSIDDHPRSPMNTGLVTGLLIVMITVWVMVCFLGIVNGTRIVNSTGIIPVSG